MQIVYLVLVFWALFKKLAEYESFYDKVKRMDNDPNCSLKSDKWKREHGLMR